MNQDTELCAATTPSNASPLISRLASQPTATSSTPSPLSLAPLAPLTDDITMVPQGPMSAPCFAASQFQDSIRIYSLHPVISYTGGQYFCTALTGDGDIDFASYSLFVYAVGDMTSAGPAWTMFLVTRDQLTDELRAPALANNIVLPLMHIIGGGRNGVLISLYTDPKSEEEVNTLFSVNKAFGYCERIHNTPPELCNAFHQRALDRWLETHDGNPPQQGPSRHHEPSPYDYNANWKRWLKSRHEADASFKYIGIPYVVQGYQTVHLNGTKAILGFIPHAFKGTKGPTCKPIRNAFLHTAAMLLIVPERYQHIIERLGLIIAPNCHKKIYDATHFGDKNHLGENEMA